MAFYRYYQISRESQWFPIKDDRNLEKNLETAGATGCTILSVSDRVSDNTDKIAYRGCLYFDIDNKDLQISIDSAKELIDKLIDLGVPKNVITIRLSGSKGFHIFVPQSLFMEARAMKELPYLYKLMAAELYVQGIDYNVYCSGRGNMFWRDNIKKDSGVYPVLITPEELENITIQEYKNLVVNPRIIPRTKSPGALFASGLAEVFKKAQERYKLLERQKNIAQIPATELKQFKKDPPQCIHDLCEYKIRDSANFNKAAFQLAIYSVRSGTDKSDIDNFISKIANNGTSKSYPSEFARKNHVSGLIKYIESDSSKHFACNAIKSILTSNPCIGCPIEAQHIEATEIYDIEERPDGYYKTIEGKIPKKLTSFIMTPIQVIIGEDSDQLGKRRKYTIFNIESNHHHLGQVSIEDSSWLSWTSLGKCISGIANMIVTLTDQECQMLKYYVLRDYKTLENQYECHTIGIQRDIINKKPRYTYVEENFSVNKFHVQGTHKLMGSFIDSSIAKPKLANVPSVQPRDAEISEVVKSFLKVNTLDVISRIFGWAMSAHLKAHISGIYSEFPILSMWGGRGSGKTRTACVLASFAGEDYLKQAPPNCSCITEFAFLSLVSSTLLS
jgi:hypothetical protein